MRVALRSILTALALLDWATIEAALQQNGAEVSFEEKLLATIPENLEADSVEFGPTGKRVAYTAKKGEKWLVVIDDQRGEEFGEVKHLPWSADGKHLAYSIAFDGQSRAWESSMVVCDSRRELRCPLP